MVKNKQINIFFIIAGVYIITGVFLFLPTEKGAAPEIKPLHLSDTIDQWSGVDIPMDSSALDLISPDGMVFRLYQNQTQMSVTLYVGFYLNMDKSDLAHSPLVCYTGQGWNYHDNGSYPVKLGEPHKTIDVSSIVIEKENQRQLVWYWFQSSNYSSATLFNMRVRLFIDKLMGRDTKNVFVRISVPIGPDAVKSSDKILHRFVKQIFPQIYEYFKLQ